MNGKTDILLLMTWKNNTSTQKVESNSFKGKIIGKCHFLRKLLKECKHEPINSAWPPTLLSISRQ